MSARIREVRLGPFDLVLEHRPEGTIRARSPHPLGDYPARLTERLEHWAVRAPERTFLAKRGPDGAWRRLAYAETLEGARRIGQALLERGLSAERPLAILSGNDFEHALLALGAQHVGVPYAPISPAYSLVSQDFGKLREIVDLITPGLVFATSGSAYQAAIEAAVPPTTEIVVTADPPAGRAATSFADLLASAPTSTVERAAAEVGPDTIAKFLFTSGSTGMPKAVINTQRMLCSNQASSAGKPRRAWRCENGGAIAGPCAASPASRAPRWLWGAFVAVMLAKSWSVDVTRAAVKRVKPTAGVGGRRNRRGEARGWHAEDRGGSEVRAHSTGCLTGCLQKPIVNPRSSTMHTVVLACETSSPAKVVMAALRFG